MVEVDAVVQQSERLCWAVAREEIGNRLPAQRSPVERSPVQVDMEAPQWSSS